MDSFPVKSVDKRCESGKKEKEARVSIKKILVPIDGSGYSMRAAMYAIEVSKLQKAQILVIHVISKFPSDYEYTIPSIAGSAIQTYIENKRSQVQLWFNEIIKIAKDENVSSIKTHIFVDAESIADAILSYATQNSIDLIVMGTKGRSSIARFLLGSIANYVLQHAHCSIILIR